MNAESLIPTITSIGGGFFIGLILGYFLKKIIKILMFVAGGIVALLLYLQQQQVISVDLIKWKLRQLLFLLQSLPLLIR